ncbi:MAG: YcaO-like family protein [Acetobacteraceae bacterium]|nr:YcaO-like family protein [Acetobacteraceae bacterium]
MTQHVLPPRLPDAASRYVDSMPDGRVELFSLAPLDRTGVSCWNAIFLNRDGTRWHGVAPHGVGYGVDDDSAIIGTTGELAEAVHSAVSIWRLPRRGGSYAALAAELGARAVADPVTLVLPAGSPVDDDTALEWVPAQRWPGGETVWIPIDIAACSVGDLHPGYTPFTTPITNGLGAGPTLEFAIGHGLCELLQRDGNGVGFRAMDRGITLAFGPDEPRDPATRAFMQKMDALGIEVIPKFATDEFGTANVYCVGAERDGVAAPHPIMVTACGEAASLDREHALRKALFEFAAARVRKAFSHAALADIAHVAPPGYLERFREYHSLSGEESRTLRSMVEWLRLDQSEMKSLLAETVLSRRASKRFDELPTWDGPLAGAGLVEELRRRFAAHGMEILFLDLSPPGRTGVHVVKAFVPGLEVETMSYHRIGERGVRKLLERGSRLVGLGAPPPGAKPVRLAPGGAERLGGPAWLDVAEVDRIVGRLYPLYREPEVHSAPISMERT